ncbi:MAG: hypothetical protein V3V92_05430 [Candidatus Hydrothermarchaeales archaeon]
MKLVNKAIILGVIWGVLSIPLFFITNKIFVDILHLQTNKITWLISLILSILISLPFMISGSLIHIFRIGTPDIPILSIIFPIPIGGFIGYIIAKIYLKVK